jgi:hypothetical protein
VSNEIAQQEPTSRKSRSSPDSRRQLVIITIGFLASSIAGLAISRAADTTQHKPTASAPAPSAKAPSSASTQASRHPVGMPDSARQSYAVSWGVDQLSTKLAESGQLVRFSYRVIDVPMATPLHEKASTPYLLDEKAHAVLEVPTMEKVGALRQSGPPEYGKSYWMVFSNKGNIVKAGHKVSVVIGQFRVDGLVVQ